MTIWLLPEEVILCSVVYFRVVVILLNNFLNVSSVTQSAKTPCVTHKLQKKTQTLNQKKMHKFNFVGSNEDQELFKEILPILNADAVQELKPRNFRVNNRIKTTEEIDECLRDYSIKYELLQLQDCINTVSNSEQGTFQFSFVKMELGKFLQIVSLIVTVVHIPEGCKHPQMYRGAVEEDEGCSLENKYFKIKFVDASSYILE
jgi:hypothetical protein